MVLQLVIGLMAIAAASLLITQGRRRRVWSVFVLAALFVLAYFFIESLSQPSGSGFIYQWLPYQELKADFNISSSLRMQQMFLPLICVLTGLVYLNTLLADEQHSLHFNILLLLNFVALILLASSRDFFQLMFAGSLLSVISFYMPDLNLAKKKILVFGFLAEMSIFMALSIVYGKTGTISLESLPRYVKDGHHKDLTAILLMFALGCKSGLFLLNGQYFGLKDAAFNRIAGMMILSVPLSGIILLDKLRLLLDTSLVSQQILSYWVLASVAVGLVNALFNNNLKLKAICFALSVYALAFGMVYSDSAILYNIIPGLMLLIFLTLMIFILVYYGASEENNVVYLGGFWHYTKSNFVLVLLMSAAIMAELWRNVGAQSVFTAAYVAVLAICIRIVYLGQTRADEKTTAFAKNASILYWLPLAFCSGWAIWHTGAWRVDKFYALMSGFAVILTLAPNVVFMRVGNLKIWQMDILSQVYEKIFVMPLKFLGRILWLAFDVVVIERSFIGSVSAAAAAVVGGLQKIQQPKLLNCILSIFIGLILMLVYLGFYGHE